MTTYTIEKGVPVPARAGFPRRPIPYPFAQMAMGDSFVIQVERGQDARLVRLAAIKLAERYRNDVQADFAALARVIDDGARVRVWRVVYQPRGTRRGAPQTPPKPASYAHLLDREPATRRRANGKHP